MTKHPVLSVMVVADDEDWEWHVLLHGFRRRPITFSVVIAPVGDDADMICLLPQQADGPSW